MNPGHVNYLHYAVYCYNCVGFLQWSFFVDSPGEKRMSVKKLLFVMMVIISVLLSMEHLGRDVIKVLRSLGTF
jgi:hypothetical protein